MKAYVIKNKEGKYLDECQDFIDGLYNARLFTDIDEISLFIQKDCRVVEVTIAEEDLERKVKELQKQIIEFIREMFGEELRDE